ncbi:MAG TPA: hypothetical protein VGL99_33675 [Chloroflexota bacterium]
MLAALQFGVLAYHLGLTVVFPYDLNYGEGYVLNDALRLTRGEPIYVDMQQFPMVRSPYPPLFPVVWSLFLGLSGPVFLVGRALAVAALLGLLALLAWNAGHVRCGAWPVVVAPALLAASPFVYQWGGYARVDLLALFLAAAGVCAAQWLGGWRGVLASGVLCVLALWTKQTTLTAALAVGIALTLRSPQYGLGFAVLVGVPSFAALVTLDAATGGEFARHVLEGNAANPVYPLRAAYYILAFGALHLPMLAAGLWWVSKALRGAPSPIALYVPIALLGALSAGNAGSSVNYLLEPAIALALAVPFVWRAASGTPLIGPLLAAVQLLLLVHWPNGFGTTYLAESALGRTPTAGDASVGAQLDAVVRATRGELIAEPAGFAVRNGRPVHIQPIDLRAEELRGRWRDAPLVQALRAGRFELVITAFEYLPSGAEQALRDSFTLDSVVPSPDGLTFRVYRFAR